MAMEEVAVRCVRCQRELKFWDHPMICRRWRKCAARLAVARAEKKAAWEVMP